VIVRDLLLDAFDRIQQVVGRAIEDLTPEQLTFRVDPQANTIGWLVWHLTRIQDDHIAAIAQRQQVWRTGGWVERFDVPFDIDATGYGHNSEDVGAVKPKSAALLLGYHEAVHDQTIEFVRGLGPGELDQVIDERRDPPVTVGVRLVSVVSDDLQHAGQAAFIRGVIERA
jgi:uncharacterized damage-inducible protein DinB